MTRPIQSIAVTSLLIVGVSVAGAQPGATEPTSDRTDVGTDAHAELAPPSTVIPVVEDHALRHRAVTVAPEWGGGVRVTGLSGIGALPGVNYGGELAVALRHDGYFAELAFGWWKPEKTYMVTSNNQSVELGLDVWTLRAGWASRDKPLRGWLLGEVGEVASVKDMPGVVTRMVAGDVPQDRRWRALGAGFGVAWPISDNTRLFGMIELAVPVEREAMMLDQGPYTPDPLVARSSAGLEVGWF